MAFVMNQEEVEGVQAAIRACEATIDAIEAESERMLTYAAYIEEKAKKLTRYAEMIEKIAKEALEEAYNDDTL